MKESLYLQQFKLLAETTETSLRGDWMLVEHIPREEKKTASGIVMPTDQMSSAQVNGVAPERKLCFVRVLYVGEGYDIEQEDGTLKKEPLESQPGDIVAVPFTHIKWFSDFGPLMSYKQDTIGLMQERGVQWNLGNEEKYKKVFEVLNGESDE